MLLGHFFFFSILVGVFGDKKVPYTIFSFAPCHCHKCICEVSFMWQHSAYYWQVHWVICWLNYCPAGVVLLEPSFSLTTLKLSKRVISPCPWILSLVTSWDCLLFSALLDLKLPRSLCLAHSLTLLEDGFQKLSEEGCPVGNILGSWMAKNTFISSYNWLIV